MSTPRVTCKRCRRNVPLRTDNLIQAHFSGQGGGHVCDGTYENPDQQGEPQADQAPTADTAPPETPTAPPAALAPVPTRLKLVPHSESRRIRQLRLSDANVNRLNALQARLKELRLAAGYDRDQMIRLTGISRSTQQRLEQPGGDPLLYTLMRYADGVGYELQLTLVPKKGTDNA